MADPAIRDELVDLLLEQYDLDLTAEQQALIGSATDAEHHATENYRAAEFDSLWRRLTGRATAEEYEFWDQMPDEYDDLPETARFVLRAMYHWPWPENLRDKVLQVLAEWSPEQRALLEERFSLAIGEVGFHWEG